MKGVFGLITIFIVFYFCHFYLVLKLPKNRQPLCQFFSNETKIYSISLYWKVYIKVNICKCFVCSDRKPSWSIIVIIQTNGTSEIYMHFLKGYDKFFLYAYYIFLNTFLYRTDLYLKQNSLLLITNFLAPCQVVLKCRPCGMLVSHSTNTTTFRATLL